MSKRVLASLIVCVALLTQIGASFWGAAAARDGHAPCHRQLSAAAAKAPSGVSSDAAGAPMQAPAPHDHASCSLCQLGFSVVRGDTPVFVAQAVVFYSRVARAEPQALAPRSVFNASAPARAPPSRA